MDSHIAVTNKQAAGIVRGYGGQELNSCLERLMCAVMKKGNFDPLDVFKKNYICLLYTSLAGNPFSVRSSGVWG